MEQIKVLLADDEPLVRMDVRVTLETIGCQVIAEVEDGKQALDLTRSLRPDLVILDVMMPNMDGLESARRIRAEHLAPVILLTGYSEEDMLEKADTAGVLAYIRKPFRKEDLGPAIKIALGRHRERKSLEFEIDDLKDKMEARKLVGRAKAFLMQRHNLTEREAFHRIQSKSQMLQRPAHEIAKAIIIAEETQAKY
jgi:AmiR/NasT family two-component response regulator